MTKNCQAFAAPFQRPRVEFEGYNKVNWFHSRNFTSALHSHLITKSVKFDGSETGEVLSSAEAGQGGGCGSPSSVAPPINSKSDVRNTPMIGEGQAVGALCTGHAEGSEACLPSDRAEDTPDAPAVIAGAPSISADHLPVEAEASGGQAIAMAEPAASFDMPDLPAFLDRRSAA